MFQKLKNRKNSNKNTSLVKRKTTIIPTSPRHLMFDSITIGKNPTTTKGIP